MAPNSFALSQSSRKPLSGRAILKTHIDWVGFLLICALATSHAAACLGGARDSILAEQKRLQGTLHDSDHGGYRVLQIDTKDGTVLRQYVNSNGVVFGVTWQSIYAPKLRQWLGIHFTEFQREVQSTRHRHGPLLIRTGNIVVQSQGHMRGYHGYAFVPRLTPTDLTEAVFQ
jgi:hypothetical protein